MNYEKLTLAKFQEKLDGGHYDSLTGARRAIGKASDWSERTRSQARELADKHFGAEAGGKPAKAPKAAKKAASAAVKGTGKRGRKPGTKMVASAKSILPAPPSEPRLPKLPLSMLNMPPSQIAANPLQVVAMGSSVIDSMRDALASAKITHDDNKDIDISEIQHSGIHAITKATMAIDQAMQSVLEAMPVGAPAEIANDMNAPTPNGQVPDPETQRRILDAAIAASNKVTLGLRDKVQTPSE